MKSYQKPRPKTRSKNEITSTNSEKTAEKERKRNDLQEGLNSTKTLDELNEQKAELQRKNAEDQAIINDENTSPSEREAAEGRVAERNEEDACLQTQIKEREKALRFSERIKEIFKKHGVMVASIVLAAGVTIGSVLGVITNALTSTGKALGNGLKSTAKALKDGLEETSKDLGNGLKEIGKKIASILPGLLGSIVSFIFKVAGQAIGFLAEHTWLLILAVVAFLIESFIKKQR